MAADPASARPAGIAGSALPGPWPVGDYAAALRGRLREFARVQLFGELWNLAVRPAKIYFELRDAGGAVPCAMWRDDWERHAPPGLGDGARLVVGGGPDYYPGSATASPAFSFLCAELRVAGEGDLLAQVDRLRKALAAEDLLERQRALARPALPRTIGVVTAEGGKARDDVLAGLRRQGWEGRLVWAWAPVQDRRAAPRIAQALRDLVALARPDVIVVARGGGSLADLFAFCDETLCRTVALLPVPVIASVGHHADRTLLDDVAALSCSTPTHAAQAAVPVVCPTARDELARRARRLGLHGRRAVIVRARVLSGLARAPAEHVARHRRRLREQLRELGGAARRRAAEQSAVTARRGLVLARKAHAAEGARGRAAGALAGQAVALARAGPGAAAGRRRDLERLALALAAHEPARTLARGYALVEDEAGGVLTAAAEARAAGRARLRFHDGSVEARIQ